MAARSSVQSGDWSSSATWGAAAPGDGDTAQINSAHVVSIDGSITVGTNPANNTTYVVIVKTGGTLKWKDNPTGSWTFTVKGNITVERGGVFQIGDETTRIPAGQTATLYFPTDTGAFAAWRMLCQGTFKAYGAQSYHMADANSQRAKLTTAIAPGSGVSFTVDAPVDWQTGDIVFVGVGGDKTAANPTADTAERVTITRTNATTFTATFAYAHAINDFAVHGARNVIIRGGNGAGKGFCFFFNQVSTAYYNVVVCNIDWAKLQYCGVTGQIAAVVYKIDDIATENYTEVPATNLKVSNTVFDMSGGDRYTGPGRTDSGCVEVFMVRRFTGELSHYFLENVHAWDMSNVFYVSGYQYRGYTYRVDKISALFHSGHGFRTISNMYSRIHVSNVWFEHRSTTETTQRVCLGCASLRDSEIHVARGVFRNEAFCLLGPTELVIENTKIYHTLEAVESAYGVSAVVNLYVRNCEFRVVYYAGIEWNGGRLEVSNTSFDACNGVNDVYSGAVRPRVYAGNDAIFDRCTFGMAAVNYRHNIVLYESTARPRRVVLYKCQFKEPLNWTAGGNKYYKEAMLWSAYLQNSSAWTTREQFPAQSSIEWVNCIAQNAAGADRWAIDCAGITHLAYTGGGGEVRNEPTNIIDGTFAKKILPFMTRNDFIANYTCPVQVYVDAGKTVTCKLSFKRTATGNRLPGLRLAGSGILSEARMTKAAGDPTWDELTVSGVASHDGMVDLFVLGGTNITTTGNGDDGTAPPIVTTNPELMFGVIVYADKLQIGVV
jgi:hypothetical protein